MQRSALRVSVGGPDRWLVLRRQRPACPAQAQADIADIQARGAMAAGERESSACGCRLRAEGQAARRNGRQRVDMTSGSAQQVLNTTDVMGEADANTIRLQRHRVPWGYRTQAAMSRVQADGINPGLTALSTGLGQLRRSPAVGTR